MSRPKANCLICGEELQYITTYKPTICALCGQKSEWNVQCVRGHFVCDNCHRLPANDFIAQFCIMSKLRDPIELAARLMRDSRIAIHGPEHHFLVPAVLLSTYYNVVGSKAEKEEKIKIAQKRAANVLGGFCGFYGDCGAAVGVGIFISVITGATPLSVKEWRLSNLATAKSLITIAEYGGPRCCKRNTILAIQEAIAFVKEELNITLPVSGTVKCEFTELNKQCLKEKCRYYLGM